MFFMRGGSGRSTGTSRSASLREIDEEAAVVDDGGGKLYVAVGKDFKDGKSNLSAARSLSLLGDLNLILLHVHQPAERIMSGFCKVPASQLEENELKAYRKIEQEEMTTLLNQYMDYCRLYLKVQAETLVIEKNNAANGILELITQHRITKLVMGTSSLTKRQVPKSKVAAIVHQQAKLYCQIFFIYKESLACTREANLDSIKADSPRSSSASTLSDESELRARSVSLPPGHPGYMSSPDQQVLHQRSNSVSYPLSGLIANNAERMSPIAQHSIRMTPRNCSPNSSLPSNAGSSSSSLKDMDTMDGSSAPASIVSSEEQQISMVETSMHNEAFEQLQQVRNELERSRKEASEGRQKAERELFEASRMFKARENALRKEKREIEERLTGETTILQNENLQICNELQKANEQRAELENKLLQTNSLLEELQQLQGDLQREKEDALREVEEMRKLIGNSVFGSAGDVALTEFSYGEIKEATNNFDDSKEIGHGGCASVYEGFLRHTTVAIKKFNREGIIGEREFNDEVEVLSRMRHPNLVTLIGVCRDPKVLVYEFLANGSLEDRLQCKHHTEPLPWRIRIRIAVDICTALIFLHSNKPKSIAHGDLKPDNVLLGANFVGKLGDFGISHSLNLTNTTVTPYHRTDQIKGTLGYMDPGYIASGELTAQYDVYSFGVVLLRLLTAKNPLGLQSEVEAALSNGALHEILDASAGEWPPEYAQDLASLALKCCRYDRKERPDLAKEAWGVLQAMMNEPSSSSLLCPDDKCETPSYFMCPMTQEIMRDPHIAADGFTYEGEAIKDWIQRGHKMSPVTYLNFAHHQLIPNNALRFVIQEWQMRQQQ
ncbi:U-box domain-containing protein 33-like [Phragmites australis]|uniref:U-box domain-containing protein 33-like n=1 Tax=Phragmites australis TaxID=29695 RepID=UPI002D799FBC|nr:U-box domain-containing protein 33-like [Phragmites australis]